MQGVEANGDADAAEPRLRLLVVGRRFVSPFADLKKIDYSMS
jgi:hypothetical protein